MLPFKDARRVQVKQLIRSIDISTLYDNKQLDANTLCVSVDVCVLSIRDVVEMLLRKYYQF